MDQSGRNAGYAMKLADFDPCWSPSMIAGVKQLRFMCPLCGPPYLISVLCRLNGPQEPGIWACAPDIGTINWQHGLTLSPSIVNSNHGRKKTCGWHGSVINGELIQKV